MSYPQSYLQGITLFNQGAYWHAHEAWEELWMAQSTEEPRRFLQGLIQTAAALVHWQRGNRRGLLLNWAKARPKLAATPSPYWGLALQALIEAMDRMAADEHALPPQLTWA